MFVWSPAGKCRVLGVAAAASPGLGTVFSLPRGRPDGPCSELWGGSGKRREASGVLGNVYKQSRHPGSLCCSQLRGLGGPVAVITKVKCTQPRGGLAVALKPGICFQKSWGKEEATWKLPVLFAPPGLSCLPRPASSRLWASAPGRLCRGLPQGQGSVWGGRRKGRAGWHWGARALPDVPLWGQQSLALMGLRPSLTRGPAGSAGARHR